MSMRSRMKTPLDTVIGRWLIAERDGRESAAEGALGRIFEALPTASPSAGFADRVLAGVGLGRVTPVAAVYPWWSRAAIAACLILAGLASAYTLPLVFSLTRLVAPAEVAGVLVQGFVALVGRVDEALSLWRFFAGFIETLMLIVTAPPVLLTLLTLTVLSAFTFHGLSELLSLRRNPGYVQAH